MKVIGIGGSSRKGGNSDILLDMALEGARSRGAAVEKIVLNDLVIKPWQQNAGCKRTARGVIKDSMGIVYKKFDEADAVIVASPIYFGSVTAQLKAMIDRFQPVWIKRRIRRKTLPPPTKNGIFLCVSGFDQPKFFRNAKSIVKIFFKVAGIAYNGDLYAGGVDKKGAVNKNKEILEKAFLLGARLAGKIR